MTQIPHWNDPALWREKFPAPSPQDHKYTRGHAVLFGGDEMTGATQLASLSCRRTGAGLVTILCSEKAHPIYALSSPGTLTHIVTSAHDRHSFLQDKRKNAILVGPGLTPNQETKQLVCEVLTLKRPTVLDAGALKAFAANPQELFQLCTPSVLLTPHGGEFNALFSHEGSKAERALAAAQESQALVVLKGPGTVIAHPDGRVILQKEAPPWLATAGTGDVLSGMILGFLAQHVDSFDAASMAIWIHSHCAQTAGFGLIAEDLIEQIPTVMRNLLIHQHASSHL